MSLPKCSPLTSAIIVIEVIEGIQRANRVVVGVEAGERVDVVCAQVEIDVLHIEHALSGPVHSPA